MCKKLKKGFTLVELVVVLVLMGLITTAIAMVLRPTTSLYIDVNNKTNEEIAAITLFDVLNGELRYATDINIVSATDDTTMPSSTLQHFIMLSNGLRDGNHLGAHGYIKHGYTAHGIIGAKYVGNSDSLLENTDIKFSVDGYSAEVGKESLTIGAVMHPMNTKGIMKEKEYKYSETFKLLNMQNRAQLTQTTVGSISTINYDGAEVQDGIKGLFDNNNNYTGGEQAIFIFYQRPEEAPSTVSSTSISTSTTFQPFTATRGNKEIDLGAVIKEAVIHVDSGVTGNIELHGGVSTRDAWGNPQSGDGSFSSASADYKVNFSGTTDNDYILFHLSDGTTFKVTGAELDASPVSIEKYLYDDGSGSIVHDTEYLSPDSLEQPVVQTIHFVKHPNFPDVKGITVQNNSGKNKAISAGAEKLNANASTTTKGGNFNVDIVYYLTDSSAMIKLAGEYNTLMDVGEFNNTDCPEIWVTGDGSVFETEEDCLLYVPVPSMSVDASGVTVSGTPSKDYCELSYSIPITNTSSCVCKDYTVGFHFVGMFTPNIGGCSIIGVGYDWKSVKEFTNGDFTVEIHDDTLLPGETKTIIIKLAGSTGQDVNDINDYTPTSVWGNAN